MLRPWPADDGLLVRLRLPGGRVTRDAFVQLLEIAEEFGDGAVHVTTRTNLQLRALPAGPCGRLLPSEVEQAFERTGLLPSRAHDVARNIMASPQTGLSGGRADLRPVVAELDRLLCTEPALAALPGRFLHVLDDGRGDVLERTCDLGLVALDAERCQLRVGRHWSGVVPLAEAPSLLIELALRFLAVRGQGPGAAWHVHELAEPLTVPAPPAPGLPGSRPPLQYGGVPGGLHVPVPASGLTRADLYFLTSSVLIVTPWRGVLVPPESR
ncbi:nitrite reductase [Nocardioides dubius]|uniref:Nitrite/Sulfite reductase ferredoxin-like domain-containing protein n=1 Tax=Nocardioides dubius TaxID=317019 RepID=A0ABN1TMM0_9ACTN